MSVWGGGGGWRKGETAVSGTHMTVILLQAALFGNTVSAFSLPLTPICVTGHKHLPGTNVLRDSRTAQEH